MRSEEQEREAFEAWHTKMVDDESVNHLFVGEPRAAWMAWQARSALASAPDAGEAEADMRHILLVQIHNLIDLGERYSRLMHKRGDADERDRIDGEIAHVRNAVAPFNYNGPTRAPHPVGSALPADKWSRDELWHSLAKANSTNAYLVREIVLGYLEAMAAAPAPAIDHHPESSIHAGSGLIESDSSTTLPEAVKDYHPGVSGEATSGERDL